MDKEYLEAFFFASQVIAEELNNNNPKLITLVSEAGRFELVELCEEITNAFQRENSSREWDGEFLEEIEKYTKNHIENL